MDGGCGVLLATAGGRLISFSRSGGPARITRVSIDQSWLDPSSAWWAKLDRAGEHVQSLREQVERYRAAKPFEVRPEPTDAPGRLAYLARINRQVPIESARI